MKDFRDSHNKRCKRKITEYLESLEPETCEAVKGEPSIKQQLLDLGIQHEQPYHISRQANAHDKNAKHTVSEQHDEDERQRHRERDWS
jgi:hypothetical protein